MSLTFYYGSGSPFAWKVWLALEHKAVPYEFRLLSFDRGDTKAPEFLSVNPRGRVPTIVDEGFAAPGILGHFQTVERVEDVLPALGAAPAPTLTPEPRLV